MNNYENWLGTYKTLATCPISAKIVGDNVTLTVNITQGTAPYTITYKKDGLTLGTPLTAPSIGIYPYVYTTVPDDEGIPTFSVDVVDSCIIPQTWSDQCIVTINTVPICTQPSCSFTVI